MKKIFVVMMVATVAMLGFASTGLALHDGGVAHCDACHTMHNSQDGTQVTVNPQFVGNQYLLTGSDQSSTCLNCHESASTRETGYYVSTAGAMVPQTTVPIQLTPGGDFAWLKMDYAWISRGTAYTEAGEVKGHNIVAADYGYVADTTLTSAPGGALLNTELNCASCHDPHGRYRVFADGSVATTGLPIADRGSYPAGTNVYREPVAGQYAVGAYRLLAGAGYSPASVQGGSGNTFTYDVPAAMAPSAYNRSETDSQTLVRYGSGMSEWCANCHGDLLSNGYTSGVAGPMAKHPAGNSATLPQAIVDNYNAYVSSGITGGTAADSYLTLVPFETGDGLDNAGRDALEALVSGGSEAGPDTTSNVMCLSCHRAHASGFPDMLRFMETDTFVTTDAGFEGFNGRNDVDLTAAYYRDATAFGNFQRVLCNKCHAKD